MKTQFIRLVDVFILGPAMISIAHRAQGITEHERSFLALSGLATIVFNGVNYLRHASKK